MKKRMVKTKTNHSLDFILAEPSFVVGDADLVAIATPFVHGRHIENAIRIEIERNFNLRHTTRSRRNTTQFEFAEQIVVASHGTLAFIDLHEHSGLIVGISGENLRLLARNSAVSGDDLERARTNKGKHVHEQANSHKR